MTKEQEDTLLSDPQPAQGYSKSRTQLLADAAKELVTRMDEVRRGLRDWTTLQYAEELAVRALALPEESK